MNWQNIIGKKQAPMVIGLTFFICLLGIFMGFKLPNALLPPIDRPVIGLYMNWPGKSAQEIEQTLIAPLEQNLSSLKNLIELQSQVSRGSGQVKMTFKHNTDMQQMYIDVLAGVNQVPNWPSEVNKPMILNGSDGANATLATAMIYSERPMNEDTVIKVFEKIVEPRLIKVEGVATVRPSGNLTDQRIDIEFDSEKLAQYSLSINKVVRMLSSLSDASGDTLEIGQRELSLNFKGQLNASELAQIPIHSVGQHIIRLEDIAQVHKRLEAPWNFVAINGHRAFYFRLKPTKGVNALAAVENIKEAIVELNEGPLKPYDLQVVLSRDDSKDIKNAISQVYLALFLGIVLSGVVLFFFLRNVRTVSLTFITVPICLAMVMIVMNLFGFSINVISLAGLALSVGLLLDAAIVVIDNILSLNKKGLNFNEAIIQGTKEVSPAIFSSTISSIIIFIPILLIDSTESQLFEDLAFTISSALFASLFVALVILPAFARYVITHVSDDPQEHSPQSKLSERLCLGARSKKVAAFLLIMGVPAAIFTSVAIMPEIDVLPDPKQRLMIAIVSYKEPLSAAAITNVVGQPILDRIKSQKQNPEAPDYDLSGMVCSSTYCYLYFNPSKGWDYQYFKNWVETKITQNLPGTNVLTMQGSLLSFALPNSRRTLLDIQGDDLEVLQHAGKDVLAKLKQIFPDANIREATALDNKAAAIEFTPNNEQLIYYDMSVRDLNVQLSALTQGVYLGRFFYQGENYPFYLKGQEASDLNQLLNTEVYIPNVGLRPVSDIVDTELSLAAESLLRINKSITVSLSMTPPQGMPVGSFSEQVREEVTKILSQSEYQHLYSNLRGSADQLSIFIGSFLQMFVFSVLILVFLLWLSLNSWKLALAVILSMPLALAGGMLFLQLLNVFVNQALDIITMIGFIILLGLVINNAILLATKFKSGLGHGLTQYQAIVEAVESRRQPIYMSTATSIFGMLPLMLMPGEGSEIYRGLAAVIVGGMTFSALFSLSFMAALLSLPMFRVNQEDEQPTIELGIPIVKEKITN